MKRGYFWVILILLIIIWNVLTIYAMGWKLWYIENGGLILNKILGVDFKDIL